MQLLPSSGLPVPGAEEDNLCLKSYRLLAKHHPIGPVHLHLHKVLPMGAGLGGGSADAAHTLLLLNKLYELKLTVEQLEEYARQLGSDCAFFIRNQPVFAHEKGDVFEPLALDLKGWHLVIVHPGIHIGTAEAYGNVVPAIAPHNLRQVLSANPPEKWKELEIRNDFEKALFPNYPQLPELKQLLYNLGAAYASMSGSGSAVYGLFREEKEVKEHVPAHYMVWQAEL